MARGNGNSKTVVNMNEARASRQQKSRKGQNMPKNQTKSKDVKPNSRRVLLSYSFDYKNGDQSWFDDYVIYEDNGRFFVDSTDGYTLESKTKEITAADVLTYNEKAKQVERSSSGDVLQLLSAEDEDWISMEAELGFTTPETSKNVKVDDSVQSTEDNEVDKDDSEEIFEESAEIDVMAGLSTYERGIFADVKESYFAKYNEAVESGHLLDLSGKPIPTFLRAINSYNRGVNDIGFLYIVDAEGKVIDAKTALNADECYLACKDASQFKNGLFSRFMCKAIKDYPEEVLNSQFSYFSLYPEYLSVREKEFEENEYADEYPLISFVDGFPFDSDITIADMQKQAKEKPKSFLALAENNMEEWNEYNKSFEKFESNWNTKEKQRQEKIAEEVKQQQDKASQEILEAQIIEDRMKAEAVDEYHDSIKAAKAKAKRRPSNDISRSAHIDIGKANYTREERLRLESEQIRGQKKSEAESHTPWGRSSIRRQNAKLEEQALKIDAALQKIYSVAEKKPSGNIELSENIDINVKKGDKTMNEPETKTNQNAGEQKKTVDFTEDFDTRVPLKDKLHYLFVTVADKTKGPREKFGEAVKYNVRTVGKSFSEAYGVYSARKEANRVADASKLLEGKGKQIIDAYDIAFGNTPKYSSEITSVVAAQGFKEKFKRHFGDIGRSMKMLAQTYRYNYDIRKTNKLDEKLDNYIDDLNVPGNRFKKAYAMWKIAGVTNKMTKLNNRIATYDSYFYTDVTQSVQDNTAKVVGNGVDMEQVTSEPVIDKAQSITKKIASGEYFEPDELKYVFEHMRGNLTYDEIDDIRKYANRQGAKLDRVQKSMKDQQLAETLDGQEVEVDKDARQAKRDAELDVPEDTSFAQDEYEGTYNA